jgi:ribosomal protein S18 acetylase RimI-like enzyme
MHFREAAIEDVPQLMLVRNAVKENVLSDPSIVTEKDCIEYVSVRGIGWVCEMKNNISGFAILDIKTKSIWALFVLPEEERKGIGKKLQELMLNYYFSQSKDKLWLETAANTRAEIFYKSSGWIEVERHERFPSNKLLPAFTEIKMELSLEDWEKNSEK